MRSITLTPAELRGLAKTHGGLDVGKAADMVVLSGPPLDIAHARVEQVYMEGRLAWSL